MFPGIPLSEFVYDGEQEQLTGEDILSILVQKGDIQQVRRLFTNAFWGKKSIEPDWRHLKQALVKEDKDMVRLLVTWGATAADDDMAEFALSDKYQTYVQLLRRGGVRVKQLPAPVEKPMEPGQMIEGKGVYVGTWAPKDRAGKSLSKVFNVFAAPEDLLGTKTYIHTVNFIAKLKNWHGFDGTNYATDKELYAVLKDGSYNGGWIIPPRELLAGTEPDGELGVRKGKVIQPDNLFDHQNKGSFKGTFKTAAADDGSFYPDWYWSSTEHRDYPSNVRYVRFPDGNESWLCEAYYRLSCRPMRLEPRPK